MNWLPLLPLGLSVAAVVLVGLTAWSGFLHRQLSRLALGVFGNYVGYTEGESASRTQRRDRRERSLRGAHLQRTYRLYASNTLFYSAVVAVAGSLIGVYLIAALPDLLGVNAEAARGRLPPQLEFLARILAVGSFSILELFFLLIASNATVGTALGTVVYESRWWWPRRSAAARGRGIDASLERSVAFMFALSRSGMSFREVLEVLARNQDVYGEAAAEFEIAVREMNLLGTDVVEAVVRLGDRSPSTKFSEFSENLVSVLQSGQSLPTFLRDQYDYYSEEAEASQKQFLELLETLAEGYVTLLVAGPLFLITTLLVFGVLSGGTILFLTVIIYAMIPLMTTAFVVYIDSLTTAVVLDPVRRELDSEFSLDLEALRRDELPALTSANERVTDGGTMGGLEETTRRANEWQLRQFHRSGELRRRFANPIGVLKKRPGTLLYVTVPLAVCYLLARTYRPGGFDFLGFDSYLVHATLFVLLTFAVAEELRRRRTKAIEAAVPDFLDRLASVNEAGLPVVDSLGQLRSSDLGALNENIERLWRDIEWGGRAEHALVRFERRLDTAMATRAVTLIGNAMRASGDVGPVLRIAARESKANRRLNRERTQAMVTYVVVIYVAFFVFLAIVLSLTLMFLPRIPAPDPNASGAGSNALSTLTPEKKAAYEQLLFHAMYVQAVCSGLVAGVMGEARLSAGAKHAGVLLLVSYITAVAVG